jgi:hypothetical protein
MRKSVIEGWRKTEVAPLLESGEYPRRWNQYVGQDQIGRAHV